ncbi:hypothetical protein EVAR_57224_1 [Eumeta japonica]|uniref:Uncharacterized protein n=1 Tax=Eumeta variegata TaxID=151549 RepID=A0A4C1YH43_EUMVA|nr:hypothetical protein EVAR_57224_1 [Eumeta japonica]
MSTAINIYNRVDVTGLLHGLWWCTTISITHFYMISISTMSYNISEVMTKLNVTVQKILPKENDENILVEEIDNELCYGTLKRIEDAYDDLCNCCSTLNDVFGFSEIFAGFINLLQLGITFYAITMMAVSFEAVQRAARDLRRSLALLSSELHADVGFHRSEMINVPQIESSRNVPQPANALHSIYSGPYKRTALLKIAMVQLSNYEEAKYPMMVRLPRSSVYMDDILGGAQTESEVKQLMLDLTK